MVKEAKRGEVTLTKFLIAVLVVTIFALTIGSTIYIFNEGYSDVDYETESLHFINQTNSSIGEVNKQMEAVSGNVSRLESDNLADKLGGLFGAGISTVKATSASVNLTKNAVDSGWESMKSPEVDSYGAGNGLMQSLKSVLLIIVLILFFITIIMYLVLGRTT